jgi:gamma-glutamylcyclotransferase (GGCT)/AIG2-like uncharacterized protein YtfP
MMDLTTLCRELNNYFKVAVYSGYFKVLNGKIGLSDLVYDGTLHEGQYFRIIGSVFNDGVYKYPAEGLKDEEFYGAIWPMAVPKEVLDLLDEISKWVEDYGSEKAVISPFQSESFGGYSYSKGAGNAGANGVQADEGSWQNAFRSRLNKYRKVRAI